MSKIAYRSFTSLRRGPFVSEMWHVCIDGQWAAVMIDYAETWFSAVGSINDLKELALSAARSAMEQKQCLM